MFTDKKLIFLQGFCSPKQKIRQRIMNYLESKNMSYHYISLDFKGGDIKDVDSDIMELMQKDILFITEDFNSNKYYCTLPKLYLKYSKYYKHIIISGNIIDYKEIKEIEKSVLKIQCTDSPHSRGQLLKDFFMKIGTNIIKKEDIPAYFITQERKLKIKNI